MICKGGDVESLLPHLVRPLEGPEHISEYTADLWDPSVSSESLLGVLQPVKNDIFFMNELMQDCLQYMGDKSWICFYRSFR